MIGIIDYDFIAVKRGLTTPSLSAMKMSAYLKTTQENSVYLLSALNQVETCEKVYFFSDMIIEKLPKEIFDYDHIELYGLYLEDIPQIVEHMTPDVTLYNNIVQERVVQKLATTSRALQLLDSIYYQAYGKNGERLPLPPSTTRKRFYIYDKDFLSHEDCWQVLDEIFVRLPSSVYMVRPIQCHTVKQFFLLREDYEKVSRGNKIILDYFVPLHHLDVYFGKYKLKFLGEITTTSDVCIYLGKNYSNNAYGETFYIKNLYYCLNLLFSYWSRNIPIRAEMFHQKDEINPYKDIYNAIRLWANHEDKDITIDKYINSKKLVEQKESLLKAHPIFTIFFTKTKNDLITTRGIWKLP